MRTCCFIIHSTLRQSHMYYHESIQSYFNLFFRMMWMFVYMEVVRFLNFLVFYILLMKFIVITILFSFIFLICITGLHGETIWSDT